MLDLLKPFRRIAGQGQSAMTASDPVANPIFVTPGIGYDAVNARGKRKTPFARVLSEDMELRGNQRRQLMTTHRDLNRNFAIAGWMIRQHLNYVSTFNFRCKTQDKALDNDIEAFLCNWAKAENCDPGGRHRLSRLVRLWELRRVIDGDVLINRLADGRLQTIEGDRIQTFGGVPFATLGITDPNRVINGVLVDDYFRAVAYMVFKRPPNRVNLEWDRAIPARFADLLGYFDRYDQVRGISPLAAAANSLRDVYENFDYALLKAKVSQLFAMAFYRDASEDLDIPGGVNPQSESAEQEQQEETRYKVNFDHPMTLDLDPGDRAEILESHTPSTEFQNFTQAMIVVALKALDIPFCFYDEAHTNYSGARLAGISYEKSVKNKQDDLRELLDRLTDWRIRLAIVDGDLKLPAGMQVEDLKWEWASTGMPWYDPTKEVAGAVAAVNAGFSSPQRECKKLGLDFFEIIDERAEAEKYARDKGVNITTQVTVNLTNAAGEEPAGGQKPQAQRPQRKQPPTGDEP